ncbi:MULTISPECIES: hypothetical protein [Paracoccus]|uniref:hypothetical protein n=1 Tax=Paracoccus TaxID=265 RepID=UPI0023F26DC3|nr:MULTISPECIES: hypothetical protein [Paracoccus]
MSLRKYAGSNRDAKRDAPEARESFDVVTEDKIAAWNSKLNDRYGLGRGRLEVLEDPAAA